MMPLTADQLLTVCPRLGARAAVWAAALAPAMAWAEINNPYRVADFLAQCAHESGEFVHTVENLNYGAAALLKTFPKHFTPDEAIHFARQPERIGNRVYANRMGNREEFSGDGWLFRGRGPFQLTGHDNYSAFSRARFGDDRLLANPDVLIDPVEGAMSAAWFWKSHGLNQLADEGQFQTITRRINGGLNGLESRLDYRRAAFEMMGQ